jgi:hypothetical protein
LSEREDFERLGLRDDIGHQANIRALVRLCYLAVGDDDLFARRVDLLRRQLPRAVKESLEFQGKLDECTIEYEDWEYKYCCGVPMGTPEKPVLGSPRRVLRTHTDWMAVFELCMDELEKLNVTWKKEESAAAT